jgi:hypothetical protein
MYGPGSEVKVCIKYAKNLFDTEMIGKMDPYVQVCSTHPFPYIFKVVLGSRECKTKSRTDAGTDPKWNQDMFLDYQGETELEFRVWDSETIGEDKFVGEAKVSLTAVINNGGSWSGDLQLFRRNKKPAGLLNVHIYMLSPNGRNVDSHSEVKMASLPEMPHHTRRGSGPYQYPDMNAPQEYPSSAPLPNSPPSMAPAAQPVAPQCPTPMYQQQTLPQSTMYAPQQPVMYAAQQPGIYTTGQVMGQTVIGQPVYQQAGYGQQVVYAQPMYTQPGAPIYAQPVQGVQGQPQVVYSQQPTQVIYTRPGC